MKFFSNWRKLFSNWRKRRDQPSSSIFIPKLEQLPQSGRSVIAYRGILLPGWLHTVRIEHLRFVPGEKYKPYRMDATKTHHLWIVCSPLKGVGCQIVVSYQFSLIVPGGDRAITLDLWQEPDRAAIQIGKFLAFQSIAVVTEMRQPALLRRIPDRELEAQFTKQREIFWATAVQAKWKSIRESL